MDWSLELPVLNTEWTIQGKKDLGNKVANENRWEWVWYVNSRYEWIKIYALGRKKWQIKNRFNCGKRYLKYILDSTSDFSCVDILLWRKFVVS